MGFRWPFGKKQAAFRQAQREEFEASVNAYTAHLATMIALFEPAAGQLKDVPSEFDGSRRDEIDEHVRCMLPTAQSMLAEMQAAAPHPVIQKTHQQLLEGLGLVVDGLKQLHASLGNTSESAALAYSDSINTVLEGFSMAKDAIGKLGIIVSEARRLIQ